MAPLDPARLDPGIPRGAAELMVSVAVAAAELATALTGSRHAIDPAAAFAHLLLPLVVGTAQTPPPPRPAPGGGWVHADVLAEDEGLYELLAAEAPLADATVLADRAQACRLPITPYRSGAAGWVPLPLDVPPSPLRVAAAEVAVLDLTTMWAGPLCTHLLAEWGARVTTIEPATRPDGLRGSPAQFAAFAQHKRRVPWDLRERDGRAAFEAAVATADVLVESFSGRVLPNFGYDDDALHQLNPRLCVVAIRAFPDSPWVAFGRGVHAASGLGVVDDVATPCLVAYPDPLAGVVAFAQILRAMAAGVHERIEVSLAGAIAPLLPTAGRPLGEVDPDAFAPLSPPGSTLLRERD